MIAILKHGTTAEQTHHLVQWLKRMNLDVHVSEGQEITVLGLIGDTSRVDMDLLRSLEIVDSVKRVSEPFKQANRKFHPQDTIIEIGNVRIGGGCVTQSRNYDMLHQNGQIFWLQRDLELLPVDGRPISQANKLEVLYQIRKPMYEAFADHAVANDGEINSTVQKILQIWEEKR